MEASQKLVMCMHGQCIDMVSDLHDVFIGDGGKYKFMYEMKRIDDKCETEVIINLKKIKLRSRTILKYKIHVEVRNSRDLLLLRICAMLSEIEMKQCKQIQFTEK